MIDSDKRLPVSTTSFHNTMIRASAGTGKTFQLSNRYLGLLFDGIPPSKILATTFTRKAAGEILYRVVQRLAAGACDPIERTKLLAALGRSELSRESLRGQLVELVRSLHQVQISTMDAVFARVARTFAMELGLSANWTILDGLTAKQLKRDAIEQVLSEGSDSDVFSAVSFTRQRRCSKQRL